MAKYWYYSFIDKHLASPRSLAECLEDATGRKFKSTGTSLTLEKKGDSEIWNVQSWEVSFDTEFDMKNVSTPSIVYTSETSTAGFVGAGNHTFVADVEGNGVIPEKSHQTKGSLLFPKIKTLPVATYRATGSRWHCSDHWSWTWKDGQAKPEATYKSDGYKKQ
jgi:hypothetical protein